MSSSPFTLPGLRSMGIGAYDSHSSSPEPPLHTLPLRTPPSSLYRPPTHELGCQQGTVEPMDGCSLTGRRHTDVAHWSMGSASIGGLEHSGHALTRDMSVSDALQRAGVAPGSDTERIGCMRVATLDNIGKQFSLDAEARKDLRRLAQACALDDGLCRAETSAMVMIGAQLSRIERRLAALEKQDSTQTSGFGTIVSDLKSWLKGNFELTKDQRANIRAVCEDAVCQPHRRLFKQLHTDVLPILQRDAATLGLTNALSNEARRKKVIQIVKETASNTCNKFRQNLLKSVAPMTYLPLDQFTIRTAMKYKQGGTGAKVDKAYKIWNAVLRHFVFEHPEYLDGENDQLSDRENTSGVKRRRGPNGRVKDGEDFWGQCEQWLAALVAKHGQDMLTPSWRSYMEKILSMEAQNYTGKEADWDMANEPPTDAYDHGHQSFSSNSDGSFFD